MARRSFLLPLIAIYAGCSARAPDTVVPADAGTADAGQADTAGIDAEVQRPDAGQADATEPDAQEAVDAATCSPPSAVPADPGATGPWPVGAIAVHAAGLSFEVWYPASPGSERGVDPLRYDIRDDLPPDQAAKISETDNPYQPCACFRGLPLDRAQGPFPLAVFIHGTAGFKTQNLDNAVHWASRGFVVVAANHPGLSIGSFLGGGGGRQDLRRDVLAELEAIRTATGALSSLQGAVDLDRIGLVGHSAGGNAVAGMGDLPGVQVIVPLAANAAPSGASVRSTLYVVGEADRVVSSASVRSGYMQAETHDHKRLVAITGAGHTGVTSLCGIKNAAGSSIVEVATASGVLSGPLALFSQTLFDCSANTTPQSETIPIVNFATSAALEETLSCSSPRFEELRARYSAVSDVQMSP